MGINLFSNEKLIEFGSKRFCFEIPEKEPFLNDELNREPQAESLKKLLHVYKDGAVLAVNGTWGVGKTTFIRMWKQKLENEGYKVVYYNSWEDDINNEPLFTMIKKLKDVSGTDNSKLIEVLKEGGKILTSIVMGTVTEWSGALGSVFKAGVKGGAGQVEKLIYSALDDNDDTANALNDFKSSLEKFAQSVSTEGKPLVYIVDELDRCSPSFGVKVLERIKHLFDVPNVIFVLSIDLQQFCYSINGYFGSDKFNSEDYLRRFIDYYYDLIEPGSIDYCQFLYHYYGFDEFVEDDEMNEFGYGNCLFTLEVLIKLKKITLRQLDRIFMAARIVFVDKLGWSRDIYMEGYGKYLRSVIFFLAYLKTCNHDFYKGLREKSFTIDELIEKLEGLDEKDREVPGDSFYPYLSTMFHVLFLYCWDISYKGNSLSGINSYGDEDYKEKLDYCYLCISKLQYNKFDKTFLEDYHHSFEIANTGLAFWIDIMDLNSMFY